MNRYQINDLEKMTGIKAHTIRIWEKRYNLIEPFRTATNIRYYDDSQVRKLLNISTLVNFGHKISRVASFNEQQLNEMVSSLQSAQSDDVVKASFVTELTSAMLTYDEGKFEKVLSAVITRYGMYTTMMDVIYPFLHKTGVMWSTNSAMPTQEHFATCIIRRKLIAATDGLPPAHIEGKCILLFLPPDEWHEIGLTFTDYIARSLGYRTVYLGQNVPLSNIREMLPYVKPTHMITFYIMQKKKMNLPEEYRRLAEDAPKTKFIVIGRDEMLRQIKQTVNLIPCNSVDSLNSILKQ
jgi:DNA-binding transcriptional MerR regulator